MQRNTYRIAKEIINSPALGELVLTIVEEAFDRYVDANASADFCLQHVGPRTIVFGSTNRVCWTAKGGFKPDETYCTQQFLQAWNKPNTA